MDITRILAGVATLGALTGGFVGYKVNKSLTEVFFDWLNAGNQVPSESKIRQSRVSKVVGGLGATVGAIAGIGVGVFSLVGTAAFVHGSRRGMNF